jgi:hypothetical protein
MNSRDPPLVRLWCLAFRALCLGMLLIGALAVVVGAVIAVVSLLSLAPPVPGLSLGYWFLFATVGLAFAGSASAVLKCARGAIWRRDMEADISKTASDRDRLEQWINR